MKKFIKAVLCIMAFVVAPLSLAAQPPVTFDPPKPSNTPGKIEVLEFFAYTCPHCAHVEPMVDQLRRELPSNAVLIQVPVGFNASFEPLQRLFYTIQALNRPDLNDQVFDAIHKERQQIFTRDKILAWLGQHGVDEQQAANIFDSFGVGAQVQQANGLMNTYQVDGTPMFAVGGKYLVSPSQFDGTPDQAYQQMFATVKKLVNELSAKQ